MPISAGSQKPTLGVLARLILVAFTLLGLCFGAFAMYAAWQHNPQGEFHDETGVHWIDWLSIGGFWVAAIAGVPWLFAISFRLRHR
jgi:hypothetical protein